MSSHVVFLSLPVMGHVRPIVGLACRLAIKWQSQRSDSLIITIPVFGDFKGLAEQEIDRYLTLETGKYLKENIHVISLGGEGRLNRELYPNLLREFEPFYTSLRSLLPVECASGTIHTFTRAPDLVVAGFFLIDCLHSIRKVSQREVPVFSFCSSGLSVMRIVGPEALGGLGDVQAKAKALAAETGKSQIEAEFDVYHRQAGEVIKVPGMPLMYDYEFYPQKSRQPSISYAEIPIFIKSFKMLHACDGLILSCNTAFDLEGCQAVKTWAAETNRPVYAVGPILPDELLDITLIERRDTSADGQEVIAFMDRIYERYGACSLIYVAFGTLFFPLTGDSIWHFIEYILDSDIPLLFAYDEPRLGKMPAHIAEKFKTSDRALHSLWAPQPTVLGHNCTGWFLTHCGFNSIQEAIAQGVPMLAWPVGAEQPGNAAHLSITLNIAYEIIEGRTELGLKPMYRGVQPKGTVDALREEIQMILKNAFGEDGKVKRKNVLALKEKLLAGLRPGGDSSNDFEMFIKDCLIASK